MYTKIEVGISDSANVKHYKGHKGVRAGQAVFIQIIPDCPRKSHDQIGNDGASIATDAIVFALNAAIL
ncbi:MAG: hypothetical protein M1826_002511, partial [Phylliscum demangeonii]